MQILLLGGSGFIGEYLAKKIVGRPECRIVSVSKHVDGSFLAGKGITKIAVDLSEEKSHLAELVLTSDVAVFLAQPDPKIIQNFISVFSPEGSLKKIVYVSTVLLYGDADKKQKEDAPLIPVTDYEKGKMAEEKLIGDFCLEKKVKLTIARLSNVYGGKKNRGLINFIFKSIMNGEELRINGKGDSVRDYIYIEDVADWLDFLIFYDQKKLVDFYNICTGTGYSVLDVVMRAERITGKKARMTFGPPVHEKKKIIGDNGKLKEISGREVRVELPRGLEKTYKECFGDNPK